jgi:hypothetical protein
MMRAIRTVRPHRDCHRHRTPSFFLLRSFGTSTLPPCRPSQCTTASDFKTSGTGRVLAVLTRSKKRFWTPGPCKRSAATYASNSTPKPASLTYSRACSATICPRSPGRRSVSTSIHRRIRSSARAGRAGCRREPRRKCSDPPDHVARESIDSSGGCPACPQQPSVRLVPCASSRAPSGGSPVSLQPWAADVRTVRT